ncbi:hypothetical protein [Streptomyces sp. NPDC048350]|uniref:hypothetical protein n=1 Tax=Streptomyces sp. NPDC048350 TaxID=3365538 RepID=UPI0037217EEF
MTYARIIALDLVAQAEQRAKQGCIEQACGTWVARSTRWPGGGPPHPHPQGVHSLPSDLRPYRARGARVAAELDERARAFLDRHQ